MAYENITLKRGNFTAVAGYFYTFDDDQDALIVKTDDGTQAFTYPLDTTITSQVKSLEYDGLNFWTLQQGATTNDIVIRRWYIDNYVCKVRDTFNLVATPSDNFNSDAFTVEHYHVNFAVGGVSPGETTINVDTGGWDLRTRLTNQQKVVFGPSSSAQGGSAGKVEEFQVQSVAISSFTILGSPSYYYTQSDTFSFYKSVWLFNNFDGLDNTSGALYKLNPLNNCAIQDKRRGGEFQDVKACTFYDVSIVKEDWGPAIAYVKATNMIFLNPASNPIGTGSFGSMVMDNLNINLVDVLPIYDVAIEGNNVYRLQLKATYGSQTHTFTNYQYQLSTLQKFITSISLKASPAILPADNTQTSDITAIVKDQFNLAIEGIPVYFTDDDPQGEILQPNPDYTDELGVASTRYLSGTSAREVKITATASQSDV